MIRLAISCEADTPLEAALLMKLGEIKAPIVAAALGSALRSELNSPLIAANSVTSMQHGTISGASLVRSFNTRPETRLCGPYLR